MRGPKGGGTVGRAETREEAFALVVAHLPDECGSAGVEVRAGCGRGGEGRGPVARWGEGSFRRVRSGRLGGRDECWALSHASVRVHRCDDGCAAIGEERPEWGTEETSSRN
ncbi:DUF6193 family natural product biosynthesis protein [Streptomyces lateritius]|uniref:DUF6193 family natural product biosynthesis protein n=1 Tax=Streptomyces lateritius TaxID=67313 RepID=A0ABW6Y7J1_9ACTN